MTLTVFIPADSGKPGDVLGELAYDAISGELFH